MKENNTDISVKVAHVIEYFNVSPNRFAQILGYERSQTIYDILNGKSSPSFDFFRRFQLSIYSSIISIDWLLTSRGEMLRQLTNTINTTNPSNISYILDKEAINKRFIEAVMFIITSGLAANKSDVASSLNISNSKFSEILKERMNVGVDSIAALCIIYKINADWVLTGREDMMLSHSANKNETSILKSILTDKDNKIEQLNRDLGRIEAELKMAKEELMLRGGEREM